MTMKQIVSVGARATAVISDYVGGREVMIAAGLLLIWWGFREVSPPAALGIPGAVLVWMALPSRPPFIGGKE